MCYMKIRNHDGSPLRIEPVAYLLPKIMPDKPALTDIALRKLKGPDTGQRDVWDGALPGFGVRVSAKGTKTFFTVYRWGGKWTRVSLGRYPATSLQAARRKAHEIKLALTEGENPKGETKVPDGFVEARAAFLKTHVDKNNRERHGAEVRRILFGKDLASWEGRNVSDVSKPDVLAVIDAIMDRGSPSSARLTFAVLRKFFNWTVERGYIEASPCEKIKAPHRQTSRDRVLTPDELARLWRSADATGSPFGPIVQLLILTAQRRAEVAGMQWADLDLERGLWTIPATRAKNANAHIVPLGSQALRIVKALPHTTSPFVFPAHGKPDRMFNGWSKCKLRLDKDAGIDNWTLHDLRRTAASGMAGLRVPPHVVEKILNHVSGTFGGVAGVYNRFGYLNEMRQALDDWDKHVRVLAG